MPRHQENLTVLAQCEDTERERAEPMTEGRLCSLECAPNCQPQKGSLALRLRCLCGVGHSLCFFSASCLRTHDFLQSSLGHIHGNPRGSAFLHPAQWISAGPSFPHFWERKTAGDISPSPFSPQNRLIIWRILNFFIRSVIQACWWNTSCILWPILSFIHSIVYGIAPIFNSVLLPFTYSAYLPTIYDTPSTVMCKSIQEWGRKSPCPKLTVNKDKDKYAIIT